MSEAELYLVPFILLGAAGIGILILKRAERRLDAKLEDLRRHPAE